MTAVVGHPLGPPPPAVAREEIEARLARARAQMETARLDALFLTDRDNYYYFTGHRSAQYEHKMRPTGIALPLKGDPAAVVYSRDLATNQRATGWQNVRSYVDVPFPLELMAEMLKDIGLDRKGARIGCELGTNERLGLPVADLSRLRDEFLPGADFMDAAPILRELKLRKSALELALIRRACAISQLAFERTCQQLQPGVTGRQVAEILTIEMLKLGADLTHPGKINQQYGLDHVYQRGEALWLDYGAIYRGYNADIARRAVFGPPTDEQKRQHDLIYGICTTLIDAVRPGACASDIARICNQQLRASGHPELVGPKRVGHGIGLLPSEPPSLSLADDTVLEPGMVVTPEPRIDLTKTERLHIEEDVVVSADDPSGHEWLSRGGDVLAVIDG
ncbi:MAG: aminopeptidase P family protein [Chloroflexi bacterium]|nr:aminopeptidase P family protein [Chloroflexota bacterium]